MKPQEIEIGRIKLDYYSDDVTVSLNDLLLSKPKKFRTVRDYHSSDDIDIYLVGYRTETDKEFQERKEMFINLHLTQEKAQREAAKISKQKKEEKDRREFERLKKKYE